MIPDQSVGAIDRLARAAAPLPPVGGLKTITFSDEQASTLIAAGRLIQNKKWPWGKRKIELLAGESYPLAVFRIVTFCLEPEERRHLREITTWVRDYERNEKN